MGDNVCLGCEDIITYGSRRECLNSYMRAAEDTSGKMDVTDISFKTLSNYRSSFTTLTDKPHSIR